MEYRSYPLSVIQQNLGVTLSEVTFNYTHFHIYEDLTKDTDHRLEVLGSSGFEQSNFDFHIEIGRGLGEDALSMALIYNAELFDRELMERVSQYYVRAFERMLEGLDEPQHGQSLLSLEEEEQQVVAWNATAVEYPRDRCVHEQIEEQAEKTPEAMAVVFGEQRLSYRELNEKAERLARYLAEAGVGVESRVGIYLRRSVELMIGVLGALKAGATYVPLEPGLPKARLEYMIKDAEIEWALVESSGIESLPLGGVDLALMDGAGPTPGGWRRSEIGDRSRRSGGGRGRRTWPTSSIPRDQPASPRG